MRAVDLVEPPQQVFRGTVDVVTTGVLGKMFPQGGFGEFGSEQVDLVEEEHDGGAHEPTAVDDTVEEDERFHHAILWGRRAQSLVEWTPTWDRPNVPGCSLLAVLDRTR